MKGLPRQNAVGPSYFPLGRGCSEGQVVVWGNYIMYGEKVQ